MQNDATARIGAGWRRQLAEVRLQDGETVENALRRFKRQVIQENIIGEVKRHSFYLKPGQKLRVKQALARKRNRKNARRQTETSWGTGRASHCRLSLEQTAGVGRNQAELLEGLAARGPRQDTVPFLSCREEQKLRF